MAEETNQIDADLSPEEAPVVHEGKGSRCDSHSVHQATEPTPTYTPHH